MVFKKTSDYGFVGYQAPHIPRATRSARRRATCKKQVDDNSMCAFDLLATVAGNLLLEKESSPSSSNKLVKKEPQCENSPLKLEDPVESNLEKASFVSDIVSRVPHVQNKNFSEKVEDSKCAKNRILLRNFANKVKKTCDYMLDDENTVQVKVEAPKTEVPMISTTGDMYSSDIMLESNVKLSLCNEHVTSDYLPLGGRDDVKLVSRDDDENSSRYTKFGTGTKAFRPSPRVGDRRIRKLLASKYWKVSCKSKETTNYKADSEMNPAYQRRNNCYKRHRSQRDYPLKKRRLYRCNSALNSDGGISGDNVGSLPGKELSFEVSDSGAKLNGESGVSARVVGQTTPLQTRDSHVKLRIKSFKVPELFIEIPENATVGSLKRMVLEAVTALLGDGLGVGVLLQGKKIRDDNRTLLETGISHDDIVEALGFSLEPNSPQAHRTLQHEDCPSLLSCDTPKQLKRYPASPKGVCSTAQPKTIDAISIPLLNLGNFIESDHDSAPSPSDMSPDKNLIDRALIAAPVINAEVLNSVPFKKSKQSDSAQRRIRRPFSVTEVEALVQAVERLGTGRWRDVKLRAFDNAKHRTYVDLKDKWKTLVHTARISPQQRRGEPVPQELLDRVLTAHAYWSQQQVKQQLKHHSETCLLL